MKKLYQEFFCIPEQGKVSDKVLLVRMAAAAVFMVLCLCGMSASAYAYFTCSVSSAHNVIQSGQFTADATITNNSVAALSVGAENMSVATENERFFSVEDLPAGEYTVTLRPNGTASTGFFILTVGGVEYYTQQLVVGSEENPLSFLLVLAEPADVTLLAHWGTVSSYPTEGKNYIGADTLRIAPFGEEYITKRRSFYCEKTHAFPAPGDGNGAGNAPHRSFRSTEREQWCVSNRHSGGTAVVCAGSQRRQHRYQWCADGGY